MTRTMIRDRIHAFIRDRVLSGQDEGLTATTPLLELGILESFALLNLVAYLNESYPIDITPGQIVGRDFVTIEAIVDLVMRRLPSGAGATSSGAEPLPDGIAVFEAPTCSQVFITFTGLQGMADSTTFFQSAGLDRRNIIVLHDTRDQSYSAGISAALPTEAAVCEWLVRWIRQRPHIEEVYCIGPSSGGPIALIAGHFLEARMVWAFGPRPARGNPLTAAIQRMTQFATEATGKTMLELRRNLTEADREQIDAHVTPEVIEAYHRSLLDPDTLIDADRLAALVSTLSRGNGVTQYRIYYVARDRCDALVADALRGCPGVTTITVEPSDPPPVDWAFSRWIQPVEWVARDHLIVGMLDARGALGSLFPPPRSTSDHERLART